MTKDATGNNPARATRAIAGQSTKCRILCGPPDSRSHRIVEAVTTTIPGILLTKFGEYRRDSDEFSLVHRETGRAFNRVPLGYGQAMAYVAILGRLEVDWTTIRNWPDIHDRFIPLIDTEIEEASNGIFTGKTVGYDRDHDHDRDYGL